MLDLVLSILAVAGLAALHVLLGVVFLFPWIHGWEADPVLSAIKLARTTVSVIATIYFGIAYGLRYDLEETILQYPMGKFVGGALVMAALALVGWLALTAVMPRGLRAAHLKRGFFDTKTKHVGVVPTVVLYLISVFASIATVIYLAKNLEELAGSNGLLHSLAELVTGLLVLVWIAVLAAAALLMLESAFNGSVTHPYLGPILGLSFMLAVAFSGDIWSKVPLLNTVVVNPGSSVVDAGPFETVVKWAALTWAVVIAAVEIAKVRNNDGLDWRGLRRHRVR